MPAECKRHLGTAVSNACLTTANCHLFHQYATPTGAPAVPAAAGNEKAGVEEAGAVAAAELPAAGAEAPVAPPKEKAGALPAVVAGAVEPVERCWLQYRVDNQ